MKTNKWSKKIKNKENYHNFQDDKNKNKLKLLKINIIKIDYTLF